MDTIHCTSPLSGDSYVRNKIFISKNFLLELVRMAGNDDSLDEIFFGSSGAHVSLSHENSEYFNMLCKELYKQDETAFFNNLSLLAKALHFCGKNTDKIIENQHVNMLY